MKGIRSLEQRARGGPCYVDLSSNYSGDFSHPQRNHSRKPRSRAAGGKLPHRPLARSGRELSEAAHAAMRHWAKATDQEADAAARELLGIYREIQQDTRMARSQRETLRLTVRARLDQLCTQISKRIAKDKAAAKANAAVKSVAADKNKPDSAVLAQVGVPAGGGAGRRRLRPARTPTPTTASNWST